MILLLDTNILIDALKINSARRNFLADQVECGRVLATSAINIAELYAGMRPTETSRTHGLTSQLMCYEVTRVIAQRAGSIKYEHARKGRTLALADMIVATTALEYDLTLVTDNLKDFPIDQLKIYPLP